MVDNDELSGRPTASNQKCLCKRGFTMKEPAVDLYLPTGA